ncbi:PleD family two-component system response regulator [Phenylobacterium sp.]|jgi:two-component system chemotaxis response regulator CheY|uniref:PleD family two-component system response regulator n=1 Tax=Phenylobacterium sp. TaxID=1871053 RepID=UPI0037C5675A
MRNAKAKILIVDDQAPFRQVQRTGLRALGYLDIREAEDGLEALEMLSRTRPSVVVLDSLMPRLDGLGVLRAIRADPELVKLPVIMMSAMSDARYVGACTSLGIVGFLIKPFTIEALASRIAWCLQDNRSRNKPSPGDVVGRAKVA